MTNSSPEPSNRPNVLMSLWRFARRPSTLIVGGGILVGIVTGGYFGIRYLALEHLSPFLETELSKLLKREVKVGEVESFTFNRIRVGPSVIPKTATDTDNLSVQGIEVGFNPFPLLLGRPLAIDVKLIDPNVYLEQDKTGQWIALETVTQEIERESPFKLDVSFQIEDGDISLKPYALVRPIMIQVDGTGRYIDDKNQQLAYDLSAEILKSQVKIKGETQLKTGKSQTQLIINQLALGELLTLIPNQNIKLNQGKANANLAINLPSFEKIEETRGTGKISITGLSGKFQPFQYPIQLDTALNFQGEKVLIEKATASIGKIQTNITGNIDWKKGYNLAVDLDTINLEQLLKIIYLKLPISLLGEAKARVKITGKIDEPLLTGTIKNTQTITLGKLPLKFVQTNFQTNLNTLKLQNIRIQPKAGGNITGEGNIKLKILQSLKENQAIDGTKMPLAFNIKANLPTKEFIAPYARLSPLVKIENVTTNAKIGGNLSRPTVLLNWQIPETLRSEKITISGRGKAKFGQDKLTLADTIIKTNGGILNVNADGNFKTKRLSANVTGNRFLLTPFLPIACDYLPISCPYLKALDPIRLDTANIRLNGSLDKFSIETLNGIANLGIRTKQGTLLVNSQVNNGNLKVNTIGSGLPINLLLPNLPTQIELVRSQITAEGSLPQLLKNNLNSLNTWQGRGNVQLLVDNKPLSTVFNLDRGIIQGNVNTSGIILNPYLKNVTVPVSLGTTKINFSGALTPLLQGSLAGLKTWQGNGDIQLFVNNRSVQTTAKLDRGILNGFIQTDGLSLAPFLPNVSIPVRLGQTRLNFSSSIDAVLAGKTPNLNTLDATGNLQLFVANSPINANIQLNNGIFKTMALINRFPIDRLFPNLPVSVRVLEARLQATGNAQNILDSFSRKKPDFASVTAVVNSRLAIANGRVTALARLDNNLWQSEVIAAKLDTAYLISRFSRQKPLILPKLNANATLTGNINTIFQAITPIQLKTLSARLGENTFSTSGKIILTNLTRKPDISSLNLEVQAKSDLNSLPLAQIVARLPIDRRFLPNALDLTGIGQFQGRVTGKNLLTAFNQRGSLQVNGNVRLANFSLNDRPFEPFLTGTFQAGTGENIALNLRGNRDIIAATFDPCTRSNCLAPYLPLAFNIRQSHGNQTPFIATGRREGSRLIANIERFPLEILKISPAIAYSLPGFVSGDANVNFDVDLFTLHGRGQLRIDKPSLGKLTGESINANLLYQDGVVRLSETNLRAARSQYNLDGAFNFRTGEIQAKFAVEQGHIQDLLAAARVSDVNSLLRFFSNPNYGKARQVQPEPVGNPNAPLAEQVNLLAKISENIRKLARERNFVGVPTEMDIRGRYSANISLMGTLKNPNLKVLFQGAQWEWRPQKPTVDIVEPLGVVTTAVQLIPIDELTVEATLNRNALEIQPIRVRSRDSQIFLAGTFSLKKINATFGAEKINLDLLRNFVQLPLDVSGNITSQSAITGTPFNPRVQGDFAFVDGAINAQSLESDIIGLFSYQNARFEIRTTSPESIQLYASIPYPPLEGVNDTLKVQGRLGTGAITLVEAITQNAIDWVSGDGEIVFSATGKVDTSKGLTLKNFVANGLITLKNAVIRSPAFPEMLTVNGRIGLTPERLTVQELEGAFGDRQVSVMGILPFFEPLANNPNPLTVEIQQGELTLENLYRGLIDGQVIVTGTIQKPVIGGEVRLSQGQVFIPQPIRTAREVDQTAQRWIQPITASRNDAFSPRLQNFKVVLEGLSITQDPLYEFGFGGALTLNGSITKPQEIRPSGVIKLDRGRVSYLDTRFLLNRRNPNTITFDPSGGLLNPKLNLQLRTILTEFPQSRNFEAARQQGIFPSNEIPDNSLNRVQRIDVTLSVEGELNRILPGLGRSKDDVCSVRPSLTFPDDDGYSTEEVARLEECIRVVALALQKDQSLLSSSSVVKLSSSPPRSEGEIVRLLGEQVLSLFNELQGKNTEQLLQFGVVQLAIPLLAQGIVSDVENSISNGIGATDFNILPYLQTVYRVDKKSFIRFSYDYNFNEFSIRYETQF